VKQGRPVAVETLQGVATKFADDDWLVVVHDPLGVGTVIGHADIPADVLVETDQVSDLGKRILDDAGFRVIWRGMALHGGGD